jgi:hypothetical protein
MIYIFFTVYGSVGSKPFVSCIPFVHDLALLTLFLDKSDNYHFSHLSHFYDWQWNSSWYLDVHLSWYLGNSYDSYGSYDLFVHLPNILHCSQHSIFCLSLGDISMFISCDLISHFIWDKPIVIWYQMSSTADDSGVPLHPLPSTEKNQHMDHPVSLLRNSKDL